MSGFDIQVCSSSQLHTRRLGKKSIVIHANYRHCASLPLAVLSTVESVTTTSLAKEFIKTYTTTLMAPASSRTEYVPLNPILTTEVKNKKVNSSCSRRVCELSTSSQTDPKKSIVYQAISHAVCNRKSKQKKIITFWCTSSIVIFAVQGDSNRLIV